MRLSTEADRADARSLDVLRAGVEEGIALFDTADVYAHDDHDIGHNERLISRALDGAAHRPEVVTKGGLVRPDGAWVPKGSARHLDAAARASRKRLGEAATRSGAIDLYLLHVVDPRVPLGTSVRTLAKLRDDGVVRAIGLSNVTRHQLEQALAITPIDAIEIELGPYKLDALHAGLVAACLDKGIRVLAYRPLGGRAGVKRIARDARLRWLAEERYAWSWSYVRATELQGQVPTCHEIVLAWLAAKGVEPIPGATQVDTVRSIARASHLHLQPEVHRILDEHFLEGIEESPGATSEGSHHSRVDPGATSEGSHHRRVEAGATSDGRNPVPKEVVLVMGLPGAGKTTIARELEAQGFLRLNRDEKGGTLAEMARELGRQLASGATRVVLDNTYGSRASRALVVRVAKKHGARVSCRLLVTPLEQAQHNAVARMLEQHGRLLEPAEMQAVKAIGPGAQFRYRRSYEPPRTDEGFASIDEIEFERRPLGGTKRALIVELDSNVWVARPASADGVRLVDGVHEQLARWHAAGYLLAGTTWQTSPDADPRLRELLGLPIEVLRCVHPAGPPVCWCRKPMPGLALAFARAHDVDLARSVHVGNAPADRGFALRAGIDYFALADGWPVPPRDEPSA